MSSPQRTRPRVVAVPPRKAPAELRSIRVVVEEDLDPDVSYLDQDELSDRKDAYARGEFHFVGVRVEATVLIEHTEQILTSPGLWGIESDSGDEEIASVAADEWSALRPVLKTVGVATDQLPLDVQDEWFEWRT